MEDFDLAKNIWSGSARAELTGMENIQSQRIQDSALTVPEISDAESDTSAGAEYEMKRPAKGSLESTHVVPGGEALTSPDEHATYSCEDVDCRWPCDHHDHNQKDKNFWWVAEAAVAMNSDCVYCLLFLEIGRTCCVCQMVPRRDNDISHPCESLQACYDGSAFSHLVIFSSCGSNELQLGASQGI